MERLTATRNVTVAVNITVAVNDILPCIGGRREEVGATSQGQGAQANHRGAKRVTPRSQVSPPARSIFIGEIPRFLNTHSVHPTIAFFFLLIYLFFFLLHFFFFFSVTFFFILFSFLFLFVVFFCFVLFLCSFVFVPCFVLSFLLLSLLGIQYLSSRSLSFAPTKQHYFYHTISYGSNKQRKQTSDCFSVKFNINVVSKSSSSTTKEVLI